MTTLPEMVPISPDVSPGGWATPGLSTANLWDQVNEGTGSPIDTDRIQTNPVDTAPTPVKFSMAATPADFGSMATLTIKTRLWLRQTGGDDTWTCRFQVFAADGTTAYTNQVSRTPTREGDLGTHTTTTDTFTLQSAGLAASKTDWDACQLWIDGTRSQSMAADSDSMRISVVGLNGTYNIAVAAASDPLLPHARRADVRHLLRR